MKHCENYGHSPAQKTTGQKRINVCTVCGITIPDTTPPSPAESAEGDDTTLHCNMCGEPIKDIRAYEKVRLAKLATAESAAPSGVSDAMVERAEAAREKFWETDSNYPATEGEFDADPAKYDKLAMRAALEAALNQPQPGRVEGMEYERGFRDGYERRHLEVLGALA